MPNKDISIGVNLDFAARRALVRMGIGDVDVLLTPEQARTFGAKLMGASHEAEVQGFLIEWFTKQVGPLDTEQGTAIAMQFRQYCAKKHPPKRGGEDGGRRIVRLTVVVVWVNVDAGELQRRFRQAIARVDHWGMRMVDRRRQGNPKEPRLATPTLLTGRRKCSGRERRRNRVIPDGGSSHKLVATKVGGLAGFPIDRKNPASAPPTVHNLTPV